MRISVRLPQAVAILALLLANLTVISAQTSEIGRGKISVLPPDPPPPGVAAVARKARVVPTKEPLRPPPGNKLRLLVKFRDGLKARSSGVGELLVRANAAREVEALSTVVQGDRMRFAPVSAVPDAKVEALRQRAAERTGIEPADLAGLLEVVVDPSATRAQLILLAQKFHGLAEVEYVQLESIDQPPPPPAADIAPTSGLLVSNQTYRTSSGINADAVWAKYGIRGAGVRLTDCEYQYNPTHEDLDGVVTLQAGIASMYTGFGSDHGTATLGEIASVENAYGMTGIAPGVSLYFYPESSTRTNSTIQGRAAAIVAAIADSAPGDVVMLEMQSGGPNGSTVYVPAEYDLSVWNAVKTGTDAGVIVVAAAGNGGDNLNGTAFASYTARGDSGAIIVGAGDASRARLSFSTYGTRVNVQGWGTGVATLGYGNFQKYGNDLNQAYTVSFNGTSSATPIVTGSVVLIQSLARETLGRSLTPQEMRQLLVDTGKAQTGTVSQKIGPLPDLSSALTTMYVRYPLKFTTLSGWGRYYYGTASPNLTANNDSDQYNNLLEYYLGTNPTANPSTDQLNWPTVQLNGNRVRYTFTHSTSLTGATGVVEATDDLQNASWQPLVNGVDGVTISRVGDVVQVEVPLTGTKRFFRLKVTKS